MRPGWQWEPPQKADDQDNSRKAERIIMSILCGGLAILIALIIGCHSLLAQDLSMIISTNTTVIETNGVIRKMTPFEVARISPPMPPIPALRPIPSPTNSVLLLTNVNGDVVLRTIVVIKRAEPKRFYYGVIGSEIAFLGEWTSADFERWAYHGSQATANQPELVRWSCVIATTNQIETPALIHVKLCP